MVEDDKNNSNIPDVESPNASIERPVPSKPEENKPEEPEQNNETKSRALQEIEPLKNNTQPLNLANTIVLYKDSMFGNGGKIQAQQLERLGNAQKYINAVLAAKAAADTEAAAGDTKATGATQAFNEEVKEVSKLINRWQMNFLSQAVFAGTGQKHGLSSHVKNNTVASLETTGDIKRYIKEQSGNNQSVYKFSKQYLHTISTKECGQLFSYAVEDEGRESRLTIRFSPSKIHQARGMLVAAAAMGANPPDVKTYEGISLAKYDKNDEYVYNNAIPTTLSVNRGALNVDGIDLKQYLFLETPMNPDDAFIQLATAEVAISYHRMTNTIYKLENLSSPMDAKGFFSLIYEAIKEVDDAAASVNTDDVIIGANDPGQPLKSRKALLAEIGKAENNEAKAKVERNWNELRKEKIMYKLMNDDKFDQFKEDGNFKEAFTNALDPLFQKKIEGIEEIQPNGIDSHVIKAFMQEANFNFVPKCLLESKLDNKKEFPIFHIQTDEEDIKPVLDFVTTTGVYANDGVNELIQIQDFRNVLDNDILTRKGWLGYPTYPTDKEDLFQLKGYIGNNDDKKTKNVIEKREQSIKIENVLKVLDYVNSANCKSSKEKLNQDELKKLKEEVCKKLSKKDRDGKFFEFKDSYGINMQPAALVAKKNKKGGLDVNETLEAKYKETLKNAYKEYGKLQQEAMKLNKDFKEGQTALNEDNKNKVKKGNEGTDVNNEQIKIRNQ